MRAKALAAALAALCCAAAPSFAELETLEPRPPVSTNFVPPQPSRVRRLLPRPFAGELHLHDPAGAINLARQLDALRDAGAVRLYGKTWGVGLAADPEFKYFFVAFTRGGRTTLAPVEHPRQAARGGVVLRA